MKYSNAMIVPGEAVGAVTAQSIGGKKKYFIFIM
jgi:hypothetical protein